MRSHRRKGFPHAQKPSLHTSSFWALGLQVLCVQLLCCEASKITVHRQCKGPESTALPPVQVEDITAMLHGNIIPSEVCVFNPSVTHLKADLYIWSARGYKPLDPRYNCVGSYETTLPLLTQEKWLGENMLVLAITRVSYKENGDMVMTAVANAKFDLPLEDGRLFKDNAGELWIMMHNPRGALMTVTPVIASCQTGDSTLLGGGGGLNCELGLGSTRVLWYANMNQIEKNWVPHHTSTRISYPIYPTFAPHSVMDWGSYHTPAVKEKFDVVGPQEPFFEEMHSLYGRLIEFSGSTPAVLYGDDAKEYIAVGHIRAHGHCFHDPSTGQVSETCRDLATRAKMMAVLQQQQHHHHPDYKYFDIKHHDGRLHAHHFKEYAMFLYKFSAIPPYNITHLSHAFTPCNAQHHSGIVFPAGLTYVGPARKDFLIAFGDANRYSRAMVMSAKTVQAMLKPVAEMRESLLQFTLCTLPCKGGLR